MSNKDNYFINQLDRVISVRYYIEGQMTETSKGDSGFDGIICKFVNLFDGYREMPAFGVSLNKETTEAIKSGVWVELLFDEVYVHNGMPYERLLMNIVDGSYGLNLIRYYNGLYEGRCFYVDLKGNIANSL